MLRTLFFRLHVGGYWATDGSYNGGETRCLSLDFEDPSLVMLTNMVSSGGYAENLSKFSYFPSEVVDDNRKDLCGESDVAEMITCAQELESMDLYVVRADDPYLDDRNTQKAIVTCSHCGQTGHNKRTCQIESMPKPPNPPPEFPSYHAKVIVTCSNCQHTGHNKRKCKLEPVHPIYLQEDLQRDKRPPNELG